MSFDAKKKTILSTPPFAPGRDLSPKGSLDQPILEFVHFLNSLEDYVTTSSCSGRISMYEDAQTKGVKWLLVKHETITVQDLYHAIDQIEEEASGIVVLKCEAFILHILCRDVEAAAKMHQIAMECGFRESGITVAKQVMLAVRTTALGLETPLTVGRSLLLDERAIEIVTREANKRLKLNFEKIDHFLLALKKKFDWPSLRALPGRENPSQPPQRSISYKLQRWGHSSVLVGVDNNDISNNRSDQRVVIFGGYGSTDIHNENMGTRALPILAMTIGIDANIPTTAAGHHHTTTATVFECMHGAVVFDCATSHFLLSGGRTSPLVALPCLRVMDRQYNFIETTQEGDMPAPRWGHSFLAIDETTYFMYGGRDASHIFSDAYILLRNEGTNLFTWRRICHSNLHGRFFHAACRIEGTTMVLVHGGLCSLDDVAGNSADPPFLLFESAYDVAALNIIIDSLLPLYRFGHTLTYIGGKSYLMLGGTTNQEPILDSQEGSGDIFAPLVFDLSYRADGSFRINVRACPVEVNGTGPSSGQIQDQQSRVHHTCVYDSVSQLLHIYGGGIICLAFGPYYCSSVMLRVQAVQAGKSSGISITRPLQIARNTRSTAHEGVVAAAAEDAGYVVIAPAQLVKKLKVYLESVDALDKTKRISAVASSQLGDEVECFAIDLLTGARETAPLISSQHEAMMAVPITHQYYSSHLKEQHASSNSSELPALRQCLQTDRLWLQRQAVRLNKSQLVSGPRRAKEYLAGLALKHRLDAECLRDLPNKYEVVGDVLMLPENALVSTGWMSLLQGGSVDVWRGLGECFGLQRVARKARVDAGTMRESRVQMLWSGLREEDGWVCVVENSIQFWFDITRIMFCSGNCTERIRAASFGVRNQVILDLYCGIGYYTLPFLVHGGAKFVHACELNPESVKALRRNLQAANISPERYHIYEGDNQVTTRDLVDIADQISLGLLPSSEQGWPLAARALRKEGGVLHVHENVHENMLRSEEWVGHCLTVFKGLFADLVKPMNLECVHIERVKSYAPRVYHIVADIRCTPTAMLEEEHLVVA